MSTIKSSAEDLTLNADGSGNDIIIQSNASTKVTVDGSAGDVKVESGDLFFATAGKGICLGVTSNTDSNTLDDYEEGTWTPVYTGSTTDPTGGSYSYQSGFYTKIGRYVFCSAAIICGDAFSDVGSGALRVSGLPFLANVTGTSQFSASIGQATRWTTKAPQAGLIAGDSTYISLYADDGGNTTSGGDQTNIVAETHIRNDGNSSNNLRVSVSYMTAA